MQASLFPTSLIQVLKDEATENRNNNNTVFM